ncbi:Predicted dehydrogenase [Cyclobacterium xiamenense]|uniref:Predicted dehydrogenase n=1 Tax=Cyclobacterium xiamenense TaxID=1297121 RepID=A0A1H7A9E4_9BACT|nr:Gfo/Idh/MocA family oxidoreductase [Cyclobacterium xiamenense]SEJ62028.1 Predicted dehydrogenase [Cyclobacterium xiamenense]
MNKKKKNLLSRRKFMGTGLLGAAGMGMLNQASYARGPLVEGAMDQPMQPGKTGVETLRLGFIGLGRQANGLLSNFIALPDIEVIAGCDVYGAKRQRFLNRTTAYYQEHNRDVEVAVYENYHDLLARKDVDAVVIATPDHWHALISIDACRAGKDIYLEKPLTYTIREGQELIKAVRSNNIVLATGCMQRSFANFQHAVKMVHKGRIGPVSKVYACVGGPPKPFDLPKEEVPADLNWDLWLGPLNAPIHFNHELNPPISLDPPENEKMWGGWRWYKETGGGLTTDWGAHMFDIAQWAIGMDRKGPVSIIPAGYQDTEYLTFTYPNGVTITEQPFDKKETRGCKFFGKDGWIEVSRSHYEASDPSLYPSLAEGESLQGGGSKDHYIDFIESVRRRKDPIASVEIGHSTCVTCTLGNIAYDLGRPLNWDPDTEQFVNDPEAEKHLHRAYRPGYRL